MFEQFSTLDLTIILAYFTLTLGIGLWVSRRRDQTSEDYFLAGRNLGWVAIGLSLFATNISSEHILGLAGTGASRGLASGSFEWMAVIILIAMGWFIAPVFIRLGLFTVPEYLEIRYDRRSRHYLTTVSIVAYIITKISVMLFAGGILLQHLLGWDMYSGAILLVLFTGIYTVVGGLTAVVWTQVFQSVVLIAGSLVVTLLGLQAVGGWDGLVDKLPAGHFTMFKPMDDPDFPWTGIVFGAPILGFWYWCTDQYIVQRVLGARSVTEARWGTFFAAVLKLIPVFVMVLPGLIAVALFPDISGDDAYPALISGSLLPIGLKGLVVAGILGALMSSLAAVMNSAATLFTVDFYQPRNPGASERKLILAGRLATLFITITAILWVPLTKLITSNIYIYMQSVQAYISPPIVAVFLFGLFTKRATATAAFSSLVVGGALGLLRLILEYMHTNGTALPGLILPFVTMNFLHFAIVLFVICSLVLVAVSLMTELKPAKDTSGLLIAGRIRSADGSDRQEDTQVFQPFRTQLYASIVLCVIVIGLWGFLS
ncbi:MAG: sodium/solute symporter [Bacteroidetes bacterium]|nr:sodium/solute symporter [Bacteroidota bacterium]